MEALQYIYTSWKNGDSTEKGYMIYSRSEGISEMECTAIKDAMQYLAPKELTLTPTPQEIADIFPYAFSYFILPTGRGCVAQSTYLGKDYSGRYGNYIIHALVFDINDLPCRPAEFFAEPYIKTAMTQEELDAPCQAPFLIPTYECPGCGEKHTNLVPSKYGILKRTCLCGTKLPTTFLNGRGQLKAYCPECDTALSGDTASRQYAFPVIGGPSVGKTCFINMAIDQMMSDVAPARSWEMSFISDTEEKDHALAMKSLNQGVRLMKTELNSLTAYQLMLKLPNEKIGRRIYVYDISGEMFSSSSDVQNNLAYSYANGFIFIIDPLTLNQFAMDVEDKVDLNAYGASSKDFDDILNIMLINLEKMFGLKDKDTLKRNLAVVINKVDIPTLEEKIGETAAQQYLAENAKTCKSYMDARDAVCRNFLEEYGAGNFVRTAEAKFKTVRYFTCSALGHNHEGQPYEGKNVVDPVMWLLQQADSSIKAE